MGKKVRGGFTLIELSLSLIFISILSLTVVLLIQNVSASYRRGLVLNQVNTVGMDLVDDFRISVQNASSDPVTRMCEIYYGDQDEKDSTSSLYKCIHDNARSFVSVTKIADRVEINNGEEVIYNMPIYGAFCTGTYTYLWNSGYFESVENSNRVVYGNGGGDGGFLAPAVLGTRDGELGSYEQKSEYDGFRLLKVYDDERTICVNAMRDQNVGIGRDMTYVIADKYDNNMITNKFEIAETMLDENSGKDIVELMKKNEADLVLYELYVAKPALSSTRQNLFYAASFIIGTRRGGINLNAVGNSCKPPSDDYSELEYCAINKFNFAVMAGGA